MMTYSLVTVFLEITRSLGIGVEDLAGMWVLESLRNHLRMVVRTVRRCYARWVVTRASLSRYSRNR